MFLPIKCFTVHFFFILFLANVYRKCCLPATNTADYSSNLQFTTVHFKLYMMHQIIVPKS